MKSTTTSPTFHETFVARLQDLRTDNAAMAALRRGLGKPPGTVADMHRFILPWINDIEDGWQENAFYLVASLYAYWYQGKSGPFTEPPPTFGASIGELRSESDSIEKRFLALLNSHENDVAHHLRHMTGLLRTRDVPVNWANLLSDLQRWGWESRSVQRAWARGFWKYSPDDLAAGDAD